MTSSSFLPSDSASSARRDARERADQLVAGGGAQHVAGRQGGERLGQAAGQPDRRAGQRVAGRGRVAGDLVRQAVLAAGAVQRHRHHGADQQVRVRAEVEALDLDVGRAGIGRAPGHEPDGRLPVLPAPDLEGASPPGRLQPQIRRRGDGAPMASRAGRLASRLAMIDSPVPVRPCRPVPPASRFRPSCQKLACTWPPLPTLSLTTAGRERGPQPMPRRDRRDDELDQDVGIGRRDRDPAAATDTSN